MKRRNFLSLAGGAAAAGTLGADRAVVASQPQPTSKPSKARPVRMYVGCQRGPTTPEMLQFFKRHAVDHICGHPVNRGSETRPLDRCRAGPQTRELCEKHGVTLDMVVLPFLTSSHIDRERSAPPSCSAKSPRPAEGRGRRSQVHAESCARVGVPAIKYNLSILGRRANRKSTPGRGGTKLPHLAARATRRPNPSADSGRGASTADAFWERIAYFLDRVMPVATPQDPRRLPSARSGQAAGRLPWCDRVLGDGTG